jgi:stearoyl-CoA desaturase (delta-9 desaturase)
MGVRAERTPAPSIMPPTTPPKRYSPSTLLTLSLFAIIHVLSMALPFVVGVSSRAVLLAVALYWVRMFGITAGYHRYFAHRAFKTSRAGQFALAWLGASAVQKGPLWWAGLHRRHHRWSDTERDLHSPVRRGFWYSHMGWIVAPDHDGTDLALIPDFAKFPELRWLDRHHWVPGAVLTALCFLVDGWRGVVWGAGVSTVVLWHCTFFINSLAHVWGSRRYETTDTSRNNFVLALITMGEGWHNNHHHYMNSANQGFFWWEVDASFYLLRCLAALGLVRDLRRPPQHMLSPAFAGVRDAKMVLADARAAAGQRFSEAKLAAEQTFQGARVATEQRIAEARAAAEQMIADAEQRLAEARTAAELRIADAEQRLTDARAAAELRIADARAAAESAVESAANAVEPSAERAG